MLNIKTDSRLVSVGDTFIAIKGHTVDGHEYIKEAIKNGFDYFTTTLTISPLKDAQKINEIGLELAKEYNAQWLPSDFKKKEGYKRSIGLSKKYNLYRQNYCGCVFSQNKTE